MAYLETLDYAENFHSVESLKENEKYDDVLNGSDFVEVTGIIS